MKQMYKVFINDKEVRFIDKNEDVPHHATQLNDEYTSSEIAGSAVNGVSDRVGFVQASCRKRLGRTAIVSRNGSKDHFSKSYGDAGVLIPDGVGVEPAVGDALRTKTAR